MRPLHSLCLLTILLIATTFFFGQLQLPFSGPQSALGNPQPRVEFHRALPLPNPGPLGPGDRLHGAPFSPWNEHNGAFPRNIPRAGLSAANSGSDPIFLAAPTYGSGGYDVYSVAVADVNGDGKPDLLVANYCSNSSNCTNGIVGVLLGNNARVILIAASA
jgi:hypothetical protein